MANSILYGFVKLLDRFNDRVAEVGEESVASAIGLTLERHNQLISDMVSLFAERTTDHQANFRSIAAGSLEPVDEYGVPRPVKSSRYTVAYPLKMGAKAIGSTWLAALKMTVRHVNNLTANVLNADIDFVRREILKACLNNATWTYPDPDFGDLTIQPFANADAVKYVKGGGFDLLETDNHYRAQAAAIDDANNPFPLIKDELLEHPENRGEVIAFIPNNLKASIAGLTNFIDAPDPNITEGVGNNRLTGVLGVPHPGTLIGYTDGCWIVEWRALPDNYILATTTDGDPGLKMREEPEPELQGLILRGPYEHAPLIERHWYRRCGFGAHNRVRTVAYQIGAANYAVPAGFSQP